MGKVECTIYDCEFDTYCEGVLRDNFVYVLDDDGNEVPPTEYICEYVDYDMVQFYIGNFSQTGAREDEDDCKWGYFLHSTGEVVIPPIYDYAYPFYGAHAKVQKDMKCGFIDYTGREVVKIMWDDTDTSLNRGLCWVKKDDKYGYINNLGVLVVSPQYEMAKDFRRIGDGNDGFKYASIVKKDGKYGYIDENGEYIFKPIFEDAKEFLLIDNEHKKKYAPVKAFGKWGFIDNKGHLIMEFQFDDVGSFGNDSFYLINRGGQWGIIDKNLEIIMPEDGQRYVVYGERKIYIKDGWVTSTRKVKL